MPMRPVPMMKPGQSFEDWKKTDLAKWDRELRFYTAIWAGACGLAAVAGAIGLVVFALIATKQ